MTRHPRVCASSEFSSRNSPTEVGDSLRRRAHPETDQDTSSATQPNGTPATTPAANQRSTGTRSHDHTVGTIPATVTTLTTTARTGWILPSTWPQATTATTMAAKEKAVSVSPVAHGVGAGSRAWVIAG